ncbi:MazG family protein [Longilinea arvoryzae]|uniref:MazG family protein n=1 Tax=Longilinea arvoryzae TaxID=360412 RepID=A0A0S7BMS8_9CHLR|nr:nucleoside triphosphate pyrophosphohydrolase [Longilinea arvoryzae]GAP15291.1 MazG family protein [Longilinea arvoryzae]
MTKQGNSIDRYLEAFQSNPGEGVVVLAGKALEKLLLPPFPPSMPAILTDLTDEILPTLQTVLLSTYPETFELQTLAESTPGTLERKNLRLSELGQAGGIRAVYVPILGVDTSMEAFQEVIARLRAPDGCPWDREQTHDSLRKSLLEECYETLAALDAGNVTGMTEEFGDLLLQIVLHAQIANEAGEFRMTDILQGINRKIVRRHPHVFGDVQVDGVKNVLQNWEKLKAAEREANGEADHKGILDGVASEFPALAQAQEFQDRAARVGFDWPEVAPVLEKVMEELEEVRTAEDDAHRAKELGDLLFAVVNYVRWHKVDSETALREANQRFRSRFAHIEKRAREMGRDMNGMTLAEMDTLWDEAKRIERGAIP